MLQNLKIGNAGSRLTHKNGANNTKFISNRIVGGGGYQTNGKAVIGIGGTSGAASNIIFENNIIECNSGTENSTRTLGMNLVSIGEVMDDDAHIDGLTFIGNTFGAFNGVRSGSPNFGLEATSRVWNGGSPAHFLRNIAIIDNIFEPTDETTLDIESPNTEPSPVIGNILIKGNTLKGAGIGANAQYGQSICLELGQGAKVIDNTIYGGKYGAIEIWSAGHPLDLSLAVITGNNIDATQGVIPVTTAVNLTASQIVFTNNTVRYFADRTNGLVIDGSTANNITNNTFIKVGVGGPPISQRNGATGNTIDPNIVQ